MNEDTSSIKIPLSGWSGYIEEPCEIQLINKESIHYHINLVQFRFAERNPVWNIEVF